MSEQAHEEGLDITPKRVCQRGFMAQPTLEHKAPPDAASRRRHSPVRRNPLFHPAVFDPTSTIHVPDSREHVIWGEGWAVLPRGRHSEGEGLMLGDGNAVVDDTEGMESHPKAVRRRRGDEDWEDEAHYDYACNATAQETFGQAAVQSQSLQQAGDYPSTPEGIRQRSKGTLIAVDVCQQCHFVPASCLSEYAVGGKADV